MMIAQQPTGDRNLLFGMLALQLDFVGQDVLVAAMQTWMLDKRRTLGDVLEHAGALTAHRRQLLETLVVEHLANQRQEVHEGLATLPSLELAEHLLNFAAAANQRIDVPIAATASRDDDPDRTVGATSEVQRRRYNVLRPLGRGGLGLVWAAKDNELNREVALKELQPRLADDEESRIRFVREAEITGGLEHPGIVPVYGLGTYSDGRLFYAMRLIRGESLRAAIERYHLEYFDKPASARLCGLRRLLRPFIDACNAVAYAHSRHVVHRDLKPDNIMLGRFGETLVVDWGLAKAWQAGNSTCVAEFAAAQSETVTAFAAIEEGPLRLSENSSSAATQMGSMLGTPQFMSPEQAEGRLDQVGPASDIYSLGATLYCLLAGQAPFAGLDVVDALERVRRGNFPRPRQVRRDIPPPLEAICLKAMARGPSARYATASDLAEDLDRWLGDEPVQAYSEPWRQRISRWSRRNRAWTQAATLSLVVVAMAATLAAGLVAKAWRNEAWAFSEASRHLLREQQERNAAVQAQRNAEEAHQALQQAQSELAQQITQLGLEEQLRKTVQSKPLLWEIAADRIGPLYQRMRVPTAADVSMQTWPAFRAADPQRLAGRATICLLPATSLSEEQREDALACGEFLYRFFAVPIRWLDPVECDLNDPDSTERLIRELRPRDAAAVVLFTGDGGDVADYYRLTADGKGAVIRISAFESNGRAPADQVLRRLLKAAVHAVGQTVGIRDFAAYHCGMNTARELPDLDAKPLPFCPECEQKIWWLADVEPLERYKQLVEFAESHHLEPERLHWQHSGDAVRAPRKKP